MANNDKAKHIALNNTEINISNPAQLWCFTGNDEDGFRLYNGQAGGNMVLASSTDMGSNQGGNTHPILYPIDKIPAGYVSVWRFMNSSDLGTGVEYAYMYQDGFESNKVNNRDKKLAFWSGGQDAGSTLQIRVAKKGPITGIGQATIDNNANNSVYDLEGRRANAPEHGVYIVNGKVVYVD